MSPLQDFDPLVSKEVLQEELCPHHGDKAAFSQPSIDSFTVATVRLQSHNIKPGRRRSGGHGGTAVSWTWILTLLVLAAVCGISEAETDRRRYEAEFEIAEMAHRGGILIDTRPVPRIGKRDLRFFPRQDGSLFGSTTATPLSTSGGALASTATPSAASILSSSTIPSSSSSANSSSTSTSPSLMTASAVPTNEPLPRPFDTSLGSNFTNSACPAFFNSFLNNATFSSCLPFSLLLQNSNSFFQAEKSPILLTQTLDATCKANFATCTSLMSTLAVELRDDANCGEDYSNENALVVQAYDGLVSYPTLYQAGCLKDSHGNYCFANAITNTSSPSDPYPYFLPLGFALPGGSSPTCSSCLQQTMNIFAGAASNLSQPVSSDYNNAAIQINEVCGPTFVNATVKAIQGTQPSNSAAMQLDRATVTTLLLALVAGLLVVWG